MFNKEYIHLYMEEIESFDHRRFLAEICQWMEEVKNTAPGHEDCILSTLDTVLDIYGDCAEMMSWR